MVNLRRGVRDVHDVHDYSVVKPVEEISGEKQEDIDIKPFKGYSPITRFNQDKNPKEFPGLTLKLLAIFVVVIAIVLILFFFNREKISGIGIGDQSLDMKIKNVQIENDSAKVNVEIDPRKDNIVGIKFIFETENGIEEFTQNISINDSGEREFTFRLSTTNSSSVTKISIVPILSVATQENIEENEEVTGEIKDTYIPKPRDIQQTTSQISTPTNTLTSNNNTQTNTVDKNNSGSASGGGVPPVTSLTNTTRNITGVTNQTTTMNYTNTTNNTGVVNPPYSTDSDDETDEEDETNVPTSTTTLNITTDVPGILLQNETQVREFVISSASGSTLSICDKTKTLTVIRYEDSWKVYCLSTIGTYCHFVLNNFGSVIVQPQCTTTTDTLSNTIDYKKICEDKGGIWIETYDSSSGAAYCRLPIITPN